MTTLAVLGLAGCASRAFGPTPARTPLADSPVRAVAPIASLSTAPIESAVLPIDLPTVLALAGEKPNAIRLARERVAETDAQIDKGIATALPTIVVGGVFWRHTGIIQDIPGNFIEVTRQRLFLGAVGLLTLNPGQGVFEYLAARRRRSAAEADVETARHAETLAAAEAYFELVGAQTSIAIARDALEHSRGFRDVAASRERARVGVRFHTLQAEADVGSARRSLIDAEQKFYVASARLATILRLDPAVLLFTAEKEARPITLISPEKRPTELIAAALDARPDLLAQRLRVEAADHESTAAHVGPFVPTIVAGLGNTNAGFGGLGWEGKNFGSLSDREDYFVGAGWVLNGLGVGDWADARAASARLRQARILEDDLTDRIRLEIVETFADIRAQSAAIEAAEAELKAAEEARAIARRRLEQGTGISVEVLAAEEARTRAATRVVDAIVGYNKAQYRLVVQLGDLPAR